MAKEYAVVFRESNGVLTWTSYESEAQYKQIGHLRGKAVEAGVSEERAKQICENSLEQIANALGLNLT
jgi:hypothetical protein